MAPANTEIECKSCGGSAFIGDGGGLCPLCVEGRADGQVCAPCNGTGYCQCALGRDLKIQKALADRLWGKLIEQSKPDSPLTGEIRAGIYARAFYFWALHDGVPEERMHALLEEAGDDLKNAIERKGN